jgi:hypothetical protein
MRPCGDCTACCSWLVANIYGWEIGGGKSCRFLECNGCGVHKARAKVCEGYFCAWAQELLPEELRPDKCGVIASVENNENGQYLRLTLMGKEINTDILEYFKEWSIKMNTPVLYLNNHIWEVL